MKIKYFLCIIFIIFPYFLFSQTRVWQDVGMPGFAYGQVSWVSLYVYNETPYVAFSDENYSGKITVMKYENNYWLPVGNRGFSEGIIHRTSLYVYNGTPYVAFSDFSELGKATVMRYDGTKWVTVGNK